MRENVFELCHTDVQLSFVLLKTAVDIERSYVVFRTNINCCQRIVEFYDVGTILSLVGLIIKCSENSKKNICKIVLN